MSDSTWIKRCLMAAFAAFALCGAGVATAAVDMFLKMDGIPGESADDRHRGEIDILSFSWDIAPRTGDLTGRTARVCAHDISFVKNIDKASPLLISGAVLGSIIPKATLTLRKAGEGAQEFFVLELTTVVVSSVSHNVSGRSSSLIEQFTLNFASAKVSYRPQKPDGSLDTPIVSTVNRTC